MKYFWTSIAEDSVRDHLFRLYISLRSLIFHVAHSLMLSRSRKTHLSVIPTLFSGESAPMMKVSEGPMVSFHSLIKEKSHSLLLHTQKDLEKTASR